jgi:hypothetical protein
VPGADYDGVVLTFRPARSADLSAIEGLIGSAIRGPRCEAIPAIDRFVAARIERHLSDAAALAARRREHFPGTSAALTAAAAGAHLLARLAAIRTAIWLVLKTFLLVKALFARTEDELTSTVHTVEHFIYVHEMRNSLETLPTVWTFLNGGNRAENPTT